jgi:polysaccharide chain length determinant protein (PEP-CTERM system associated)
MDELLRQLGSYLRAMWRHRYLGTSITWATAIIGVVVVMFIPDKYEASARIYVDTQSILQPLMSGLAVQPNIEQQVGMLSRTLISRPNVEKLVRMADLDLGAKSKAAQDELVDGLLKTLKIATTGRDNLYTLAYRDSNPERAKRVVQSLTSIFVESSLGDKRKDSDTAKKFIEDQIRGYEKKLEEAEGRLKEFKLRNIETQAAEGKGGVERLADLGAQLSRAKLELKEAENARDALKRQIEGEDPVMLPEAGSRAMGDASASPELDGRIDAQKRNLDTLLQRFTEQHPDVIGARRLIKDLEEQKKQELVARRKLAAANPVAAASVSNNPVFQQLKVSLGEAEANVASLRARVSEYDSRYARSKESMKTMPQVEAEFSQLNRDYEINKKNYEQLVSRRESATLTGDLGSTSGVADFRLIDPPRVSPQPVAPNRIVLLPAALAISLLAGLASAFVASQVRPVFMDSRVLREVTGLPLLGVVTKNISSADRWRSRKSLLKLATALTVLLVAFAFGMAYLYLKAPPAA